MIEVFFKKDFDFFLPANIIYILAVNFNNL
ncbi:hypothetical protein RCH13_000184 [Chryseobacterium sp. MP_3.2]|nr:hypothetical protein [Chryseobacterium sp. MP_3.2]